MAKCPCGKAHRRGSDGQIRSTAPVPSWREDPRVGHGPGCESEFIIQAYRQWSPCRCREFNGGTPADPRGRVQDRISQHHEQVSLYAWDLMSGSRGWGRANLAEGWVRPGVADDYTVIEARTQEHARRAFEDLATRPMVRRRRDDMGGIALGPSMDISAHWYMD